MALLALSGKHGTGKFAIVDDGEIERLSKYKWHLMSAGYAARHDRSGGKDTLLLMHREVTSAPKGTVVDHINGNQLDNRNCNLRICAQSENTWNAKRTMGKSKFKGVSFESGKWRAALLKDGTKYSLGRYTDEIKAAKAYDKAAREHFGIFAATNFEE